MGVLGLTKTEINPLKRMGGRALQSVFRLGLIRAGLLTPQAESCPRLLSEGPILFKAINRYKPPVLRNGDGYCLSPPHPFSHGFNPVYRLGVDAKPARVMMWKAENLSLLRQFSACRIIKGSPEPFASTARGLCRFLSNPMT